MFWYFAYSGMGQEKVQTINMDTEYLLIPWHTHLQTAELELNQAGILSSQFPFNAI